MSALKAIHVARRQLGLDEDDYRAVLERVTGKRSSGVMTETERRAVVEEFRRLGFAGVASSLASGRKPLEGPFAKKLQALWISCWNLGIARSRDDKALIAFVKRQTGLEHVRFLRQASDAAKAVEALKGWMAREAGIRWGTSNGYDFLTHDAGKVAWAQYRMLHPGAALPGDAAAFSSEVTRMAFGEAHLGKNAGDLKPADWRAVMNAWGERVRDQKARGVNQMTTRPDDKSGECPCS
jgi:hypothetical protein